MDNLPNDPSNPNSNNNSTPPPFGSGFTPHTNPIDPNNPYASQPQPNPVPPPPQTPPQSPLNTSQILGGAEGPNLPKLYSALEWEITQTKTLLFTSGKIRIEQEGVYMESAQVVDYPQAFLDYYTNQLTNSVFKETLNSSDPNGTTITYAKDDLFLTFGVKNIFQGSGENKNPLGYKAFIEHNWWVN